MKPKRYEETSVKAILTIVAIIAASFVIFIIIFLFALGIPVFGYVPPSNLLGLEWIPESDKFGFAPLIVGTLLVTLGALVIAIPVGLASAIFIAEVAPPKIKTTLKSLSEVLAGVPSIVYGFFGYTIIVPWISDINPEKTAGYSWFAGSLILAIMILPTIISVSEDALNSVPMLYKEASLGMGATKWQTISKVSLPSASSGILAGIVLGTGRALGETMAVLLITGNSPIIPMPITDIFSNIGTITGIIASELPTQTAGDHYHALFFLGCILFITIMIINIATLFLVKRINRKFHPELQKKKETGEKCAEESEIDKYYMEKIAFDISKPNKDSKPKKYDILKVSDGDDGESSESSPFEDENDKDTQSNKSNKNNENNKQNKNNKQYRSLDPTEPNSKLNFGKIIQYIFYAVFLYFILTLFANSWGWIWSIAIVGSFIGVIYLLRQDIKSILYGEILCFVLWLLASWLGLLWAIIIGAVIIGAVWAYQLLSVKVHKWTGYTTVGLAMTFVLFMLGLLLYFIIVNGVEPFITGEIDWVVFITQPPTGGGAEGGVFPAIVGTLMLVLGALIVAAPLGILTGIYLTEYAKEGKLKNIINNMIDNLNATPSIVFGMFGMALFIIFFGWPRSLIVGQICLGLMILPTIIKTTEEAIKAIPQSFREGSMAMGATKWQTTIRVVLPPAAPGILTGIVLGIGRAAGETAPILLTAAVFSARSLPFEPFNGTPTLTYHLYYLLGECPFNVDAQAASTAFVLLVLVLIFYVIAMLIRNYYRKKKK
jgi:phosphate ABC transporter permease protein PstC/phosphate ABC transporter permease subunit PstA